MTEDQGEGVRKKLAISCSSLFQYPAGAYFCIGEIFAERFAFYGLRAVLTIYLMSYHHFNESDTKLLYHTFIFLAYLTPLLGSILADGFFGPYKVILNLLLVYCVGHVLLAFGSFPIAGWESVMKIVDLTGLVTIVAVSGAVKPCVPAFSGDQFPPHMAAQRKQFYSVFYLSINIGTVFAVALTPTLRGRVGCFGQSTCFPLAFAVPLISLIMAFVVFASGTPFYKRNYKKNPVILNSVKCICYAIRQKINSPKFGSHSHVHWLDCSTELYGKALVDDVKRLLKILLLFSPLVIYGALYEQEASSWVIQASHMNGRFGQFTMLPDQILILNPALVIILIPIFETCIYPVLASKGLLIKGLPRMMVGGFFVASSFLVAALIQWQIKPTMIQLPKPGLTRVTVVNPENFCSFLFGEDDFIGKQNTLDIKLDPAGNFTTKLKCNISSGDSNSPFSVQGTHSLRINSSLPLKSDEGLVFIARLNESPQIISYPLSKTKEGSTAVYFTIRLEECGPSLICQNYSLLVSNGQHLYGKYELMNGTTNVIRTILQRPMIGSDVFDFYLKSCGLNQSICRKTSLTSLKAEAGAAVLISLDENTNWTTSSVLLVPSNTVNILWILPQCFLMAMGEIMLAISALEFAYSQASLCMKSTLQAMFLLAQALGNLIDMFISGLHPFADPALEFVFFFLLMLLVTIFFIFVARRYEYVEDTQNGYPMSSRPPVDQPTNDSREQC